MIIFLPARLQPTGGSSTFARKFAAGLQPRSHTVAFARPQYYDLLLANAACPPHHLLHAKARHRPIIQRLDGVYYPMTVAGRAWRFHNFPLWLTSRFADHLIYQSDFCRRSAARFLGQISTPHTVIHNGVDTSRFAPSGPQQSLRDHPRQPVCITASRFRRPDQIDPLIATFHHYRRDFAPHSKLVVIGNFEGAVADRPSRYQDSSITFRGTIPNENLPAYLRAADVFLCTHLNPPCPNNVIEALACGLPVCGVADGAMPELITPGQTGELLAAPHDGFFTPRQLDVSKIASNLHKIMENRSAYSRRARQQALDHLSLERMIACYLDVFQRFA